MCFRMADYHTDEKLSLFPHLNSLDGAWTKAKICESIVYKEGANETGDLATAFNSRQTGNKKLYVTLPVGTNECIASKSIEFVYALTFSIDGTTDWAMATDTDTRPVGVPNTFKLVRPLVGAPINYATYAGIRPPTYAVASQLNRLVGQMQDSGSIIDSVLDSNAKSSTALAQNIVVDTYCNQSGVNTDGDPNIVNDMRLFMPDINGQLAVKYTDASTTSNMLLDGRRVKRGDQPKLLLEKMWHKALTAPENQTLFVAMKSRIASASVLPPGFSVKLSLDVLDGSDRLDTGMTVQVNRAPDGQPADWQTVPVKLVFDTMKIRFQAVQLDDDLLMEYNSGLVLGAQHAINSVNIDGMTQTTEVARIPCTDVVQQYMTVATGSTGVQMVVNSGDKQILPQFMAIYVTKNQNEAFTTTGFSTYNWNCLSWVEPVMKTFKANSSDGAFDRAPYLDSYPNNDVTLTDLGELSIMGQNASGQLVWNQVGVRSQSLMAQHLVMGLNTYQVGGGYTTASLPARNMMCWYTDPSTSIAKDASDGLQQSQLTVQADFVAATPAALTFVVSQFTKADIVLKVEARKYANVSNQKPVYMLDKELSGYAYRERKAKQCKT